MLKSSGAINSGFFGIIKTFSLIAEQLRTSRLEHVYLHFSARFVDEHKHKDIPLLYHSTLEDFSIALDRHNGNEQVRDPDILATFERIMNKLDLPCLRQLWIGFPQELFDTRCADCVNIFKREAGRQFRRFPYLVNYVWCGESEDNPEMGNVIRHFRSIIMLVCISTKNDYYLPRDMIQALNAMLQ